MLIPRECFEWCSPCGGGAAQEQLTADLDAEEAGEGQIRMTEVMSAEYERIKTDACAKTAKMTQDLSSLQVAQKVNSALNLKP